MDPNSKDGGQLFPVKWRYQITNSKKERGALLISVDFAGRKTEQK